MNGATLSSFVAEQLSLWEEAAERFKQLEKEVVIRELTDNGVRYAVQWNPSRIVSTQATLSYTQPMQRPCFLCEDNQVKQQFGLPYVGNTRILINPFPILPHHLVITAQKHTPQALSILAESLYSLCISAPEYVFFYNSARSGASAPDHAHYQGGLRGFLPLERDFAFVLEGERVLEVTEGITISTSSNYLVPLYILRSSVEQKDTHRKVVERFLHTLPRPKTQVEADFNLFVWREKEEVFTIVLPRQKHRPACYYEEGEKQYLVSPGAIDMGGLLITPRENDFQRMTLHRMTHILKEVSGLSLLSDSKEPTLRIGVVHKKELHIDFLTPYLHNGQIYTGLHSFCYANHAIEWGEEAYASLAFHAATPNSQFVIKNVTIGVDFHWEQEEEQLFEGDLSIVIEKEALTAINHIGIEAYLSSVISSEMNPDAALPFLKAHAIISRSWAVHQIRRKSFFPCQNHPTLSNTERIVWYDNENHLYYDLCADDHCQRYQGLKHQHHPTVVQALHETQGEVLWNDEAICDARFYKCCGGVTEEFSTCWEEQNFPYLRVIKDNSSSPTSSLDYSREEEARRWIDTPSDDFCHTNDPAILHKILKEYDQHTSDFYRWKKVITQEELQQYLKEKAHLHLGTIIALIPLERGRGGRIKRLQIEGSEGSIIIGKELEIRRLLSSSHLYSSAFYIEPFPKDSPTPTSFTLIGAGWGHGVGLCQIGAAVMAEKGYDYPDILSHYYPNATLKKIY